jgi:hypothetical protein
VKQQRRPRLTLHDLTSNLDVFLTSHENENIPRRATEVDLQNLLDRRIYVIFAWAPRVRDFDREGSARDSEARCIAVELGELLCIHRCRCNYELEIPSAGED